MSKKALAGLVLVGVAILVIIALFVLAPEPPPPVPTPTPTPAPKVIRVLGAGPTFWDPIIHQHFLDTYNVDVQVASGSDLYNYKPNGKDIDYANIAVIYGGQSTAGEELMEMYPDGLPNSAGNPIAIKGPFVTTGQSPQGLHLHTSDLPAFNQAGLIEERNGSWFINGESFVKMIRCAITGDPWTSIGVELSGSCSFGFPNPPQASGGRYAMAYLASCLASEPGRECQTTVSPEQIEAYVPDLVKIWERSGKAPGDEGSVDFFYAWANSSNPPQRVVLALEAAPFSWLLKVPESSREMAVKHITMVYFDHGFMNTQTAVILNEDGRWLVDTMLSDQEFLAIETERVGFRIGFGSTMPTHIYGWVLKDASATTTLPDPRAEIYTAIKAGICAASPSTPGCVKK